MSGQLRERNQTMKALITLAIILAVFGGSALAQEATPKPATKTPLPKVLPDLCKGAVDPYDQSAERQLFLASAGADGELSEKEFKALVGKKGFVRKFDRWEQIIRYDKDGNKTIDWFEADAYRQAFRKQVLTTFDADKNTKLEGDERKKANAALNAGRVRIRSGRSRGGRGGSDRGRGGFSRQPDPETLKKYDKDGDGQLSSEERGAYDTARREEFRQRMTERYDTDKDGKVSDKEREAAREAMRSRWGEIRERMTRNRFDANRDGKLDKEETAAMEKSNAERRARDEQRRAEYTKRWDKDGDGEVSEKEREAMRASYRAESEARRAAFTKTWDTDGDGQLNEKERDTMRTKMRENMEAHRKKMDLNGDGDVSREEDREYWDKLRKKYDADGDGNLSTDERTKMIQQEGTSGGRGGSGRGGSGRGGSGRGRR